MNLMNRLYGRLELGFLLSGLGLVSACGAEPDDETSDIASEVDCDPASSKDISLVVETGLGTQPNNQNLLVSGRASHERGLTIRRITVLGITAANDGFNHSTWSVIVPIANLLPRQDPEGNVTLTVEATDACRKKRTETISIRLVTPATTST